MQADTATGSRQHYFVVYGIFAILLLPLLATALYSLASEWGATILPTSLTFDWYINLWSDPRFLEAFARSVLICLGGLALGALLTVPTIFVVFYYFPSLKWLMNICILLPFAVPPVVSSVGLLQLYAEGPLSLTGTPWILVLTYFTIALPFMYRAIANSMQGLNLPDLMDAAHLLGASTFRAFLMVVLPNIRKGLMVSLFLSFSFLFGEFVFANMLVGTRYETLQVYLFNMRQQSGHFTSAIVISYFLFVLIFTWIANRLNR